jgi:iron(III) transport system ATP-binding protein
MISIRAVSKTFDQKPVLENFSLEVKNQQRLAVLGPSGCGKTTLLRLVAGLELPDQGQIWLAGKQVSRPAWALAPHQRGISIVFQSPALFPHYTVAQNIRFGCTGLPPKELKERLDFLLNRLNLTGLEQRYPHQLSGGEARRVAVARALAPRPPILIMDEALTNLNRELKQQVLETLLEYLETYQPTLLYVTHDKTEANILAAGILTLSGKDE